MGKLFLLLTLVLLSVAADAQMRQQSVVSVNNMQAIQNRAALNQSLTNRNAAYAGKTTAGGGRWYNYADFNDTLANFNNVYGVSPSSADIYTPYLWNDSTSNDAYPGGIIARNNLVSEATIFDPKYNGFNNSNYYAVGSLEITTADPFIIDSVIVVGDYGVNPARRMAGVVDTLRLSVIHGNGGAFGTTDVYIDTVYDTTYLGHIDTIVSFDVSYDATMNRVAGYYDTHSYMDIPIGYGDTLTSLSSVLGIGYQSLKVGEYYKVIALPAPLSCAADDFVGMSVSFKSGDNTYAANDTVYNSSGTYNFNMLRPLIEYFGTSITTDWPLHNFGGVDNNVGLFKTLPDTTTGWGESYFPEWAFSTDNGTAASQLQNPYIWIHVTCPTCASFVTGPEIEGVNNVININNVTVAPNPAADVVNIDFSLSRVSDVSVSLTNMVGQAVATQKINNVAAGKAVFNTAALPDGMYIYTLQADGERAAGHVVIAH